MTDEEYYEFLRPYEDAKQMLLTRLDVLNHNLYGYPVQNQKETKY